MFGRADADNEYFQKRSTLPPLSRGGGKLSLFLIILSVLGHLDLRGVGVLISSVEVIIDVFWNERISLNMLGLLASVSCFCHDIEV